MTPKLLQHIKNLATNSTYYVCAEGTLRIEEPPEKEGEDINNLDYFYCVDEDKGLCYEVPFTEVDVESDKFWKLVEELVLENFNESD